MNDAGGAKQNMKLSDVDPELLQQLLNEEGIEDVRGDKELRPRLTTARVPLSFGQELLWSLEQASPGSSAYNVAVARKLVGRLHVEALTRSLSGLAARHEILRTRIGMIDGEPSQIVDPPGDTQVPIIDLSALPAEEQDAELTRILTAQARLPFGLERDHLFRPLLVHLTSTEHVLLIVTHHTAVDGWSIGVMLREMAAFYRGEVRGEPAALPPLHLQFGDYALWQREVLRGERLDRLLTYWRSQLGAAAEPLELPTDFPRPVAPTFAGGRLGVSVSPDLLASIKKVGREREATLYMTLLATYATVLHRYTGRPEVLIGSGVAGRTPQATEPIVGYFNNTVVQRIDFSGDPSFAELLTRVRASVLGALDHQEVPLEKLILELRAGQQQQTDASLFQAVFTLEDPRGDQLDLEGVSIIPVGVDRGQTKFDITLLPGERDGGLRLSVHFRSDLFTVATMERFLGHFRQLLESVVSDASVRVSRLQMVTDEERRQLEAANATSVDVGDDSTLVGLFEARAAEAPTRIAVMDTRSFLTYRDLDGRANQLAYALRAMGIGANARVGLVLDRCTDAIVALLGILKAGACYVPVPPDLPANRIHSQLVQSGAAVVVTHFVHVQQLPEHMPVIALDRDAAMLEALPRLKPAPVSSPADLAYVLFTSGSTGVPKGVAVTCDNVVHYTHALARVLGDRPQDVAGNALNAMSGLHFGLVSTLGADLGNTSLYLSLLGGGTLHVLPRDIATEPARFAEHLAASPVDVLKVTPSHLRALIEGTGREALAALLPHRWIILGGEALRIDLARRLLDAGSCRVLNHYGPTETTVGVLTFEATTNTLAIAAAEGAQTVPIGRPLANTQAFVVDAWGGEQPYAIPGELYIGGRGVTQGYLGRDDLTRERFLPRRDVRVYRTGDLVRRLPASGIEFLGRADDQVKVRGYRVELGEVAQALRAHPGVVTAEVLMHADSSGEPRLVAYVVARKGYASSHSDRATSEHLMDWLTTRLPHYMVPGAVMLVDEMPLTPNGKIDRSRLPMPNATPDVPVAPRTEIEQKLATIWAETLKKPDLGVTQDFLELGGHSLLAIRILGRISRTFGVRLSLRTLFDAPTVEKLAHVLEVETQLAALDALSQGNHPGI